MPFISLLFFQTIQFSFINIAGDGYVKGSIGGISSSSAAEKVWLVSQAIGDIAFAYPYSLILIEIQVWHYLRFHAYRWLDFLSSKKKNPFFLFFNLTMNFAKHEGYFDVSSTRKPDHEESLNNSNHSYNLLLPMLWRLWICSLWGCHAGEPLDRVWILWTILAHWLC